MLEAGTAGVVGGQMGDVGASRTLAELLERAASSHPDRLAYRFLDNGENESATLTYGELLAESAAVARSVAAANEVGSRALIMCPPGLEYVIALFGCFAAGIVPVPVYPPSPLLPARDLGRVISVATDVGAALAITVPRLEYLTAPGEMGELKVDWLVVERGSGQPACADGPSAASRGIGPDDMALVQYTSGSTGAPRGVVLTHRQVLSQLRLLSETYGAEPGLEGVSWLPPYHDLGLIGATLGPVWFAGSSTLMAPNAFLRRPLRWLEAISRYRAAFSPAPSFAFGQCVRRSSPADCEGLDLSCWRWAINGAEPIRPALLERFYRAFAPYGLRRESLWPSYGMAETTLLISAGALGRGARTLRVGRDALGAGRLEQVGPHVAPSASVESASVEVVTCGPPAPETSVVAVDPETRTAVVEGIVGELWVSGPQVASGYWGRPAESDETFRAAIVGGPPGNYLRTGDLGALVDGEVVVTGRVKDVIIIRGANYYPTDFEDTMQTAHPDLWEDFAVAFSVPGDETEQLVLVQGAAIEAADSATLAQAARQIVSAVTDEHGLRPDVVVLVAPRHIPRTSSGKVRRSTTRDAHLAGQLPVLYEWRASGSAALTASS